MNMQLSTLPPIPDQVQPQGVPPQNPAHFANPATDPQLQGYQADYNAPQGNVPVQQVQQQPIQQQVPVQQVQQPPINNALPSEMPQLQSPEQSTARKPRKAPEPKFYDPNKQLYFAVDFGYVPA